MFLHTKVLEELSRNNSVRVWANSAGTSRGFVEWCNVPSKVESFPDVLPFKEFPYTYLRRLNEYVWDYRQQLPSRLSMMRHVRDKQRKMPVRALKVPARALALIRAERFVENWVEKLLLSYPRSLMALERLQARPPAAIVTTGPFQHEQPAVIAIGKNLNIPVLVFIPSWDNLTTKQRLLFKYDGYMVWSEQGRRELSEFYPETREMPVYVVGAPQFDVCFNPDFFQSRQEFCAAQGLSAELPIIVHSLGSPNFLREYHGAVALAERVVRGDLGEVQLLVRPHPAKDRGEMTDVFLQYQPRVVLQEVSEEANGKYQGTQDRRQIIDWVNTFRHADVVVNLSSTVTVDAAIFDRPIVNLDFDPEPGQPNQLLVKDINHLWTHFKPIAESGGVWLVNNIDEMVEAVKTYLKHPELHREKRRWIAEYVCGYVDGHCGERMAHAILNFVEHHMRRSPNNGN
jgi:hypothetical protein